ncbi:MAG TPA: phosphotransferase [Ktedonobacterales bacterium]
MDLTLLRQEWPQLGMVEAQPLAGGTNNLMYRFDTDNGSYVLRISSGHVTARRLRYEYDILSQLESTHLPYAVPTPIPTAHGDIYAETHSEAGLSLATLTPLIPGELPVRERLDQARSGGEALGLLDQALANITLADPDEAMTWRADGDLTRCHPAVPEPRAALMDLALTPDERAALLREYDALCDAIPTLYAQLPKQLSHEDFDPGNILMKSARVTGVLDFEFCAIDVHAMDLVVALTWWPVDHYGTGDEWPILAAVLAGYARIATLGHEEISAIPTLYMFRAFSSLIHRLGRQRLGLSPMRHVEWRAKAALERAEWLQKNGERLTHMVDEALQ